MRSLFAQLAERLIGRGQTLIRADDIFPLILASYPRGRARYAEDLRSALRIMFPAVPPELRRTYEDVLRGAPSLIVADLRPRNPCSCLGHHHPSCSHSELTRRLARDVNGLVGEIDLAIEAIRGWEPRPLAGLAASEVVGPTSEGGRRAVAQVRFHAALLAVFLHELDHLVNPDSPESEVRARSDRFFAGACGAVLDSEFGVTFGIAAGAS